jgi:L-rhamnose mutarotase
VRTQLCELTSFSFQLPVLPATTFFVVLTAHDVWRAGANPKLQKAEVSGKKSKIMKRVAFKMKLKPGFRQEYIRRHSEVWPEVAALIKRSGISDYAIFLDEETNILFGVQKVSGDVSSQELGAEEIQQKWWGYMSDIMEVNPDSSPISIPLEEVFYLS